MSTSGWDWKAHRFAFLDVETNDLARPWSPVPLLLEIGLVLVDADLVELARFQAVIRHAESDLRVENWPAVVVEMHTKSGLLADLRGPETLSIREAEEGMIALLDRFDLGPDHPIVWAGSSPSAVDRPVVGHYMPEYYRRIHYRTLDASCLLLVLKSWVGIDLEAEGLAQEVPHRALPDTLRCLDVARRARRIFETPTQGLRACDEPGESPCLDARRRTFGAGADT